MNDPETVLLIDGRKDQASLDIHYAFPMMATVPALRDKYDLHMAAERFISEDGRTDDSFLRR